MRTNFNIDLVLPWVDGSDPEWLKEKNRYNGKQLTDEQVNYQTRQYRDWDSLRFLFRGVEEFMPWIRKIHFVTNGQKPEWLNLDCKKLNWVNHEDYIPKKYLPTFSSHPIELNFHRIDDLVEHFIYFNDDTFVLRSTKSTDFFTKDGLPKDQSVLFRIPGATYGDIFGHFQLNDIGVINQNFNRTEVIKKHWKKLFSPKNGLLAPILSATFFANKSFSGLHGQSHAPSILKINV